jgi:hypothetical protein
MAKKTDFTTEEWEVLIFEAAKGNNELLRSICDRDELKAAQQAIRGSIKMKDLKSLRDQLQTSAADKAREATSILQKKGAKADLDAYRTLLVDIADRTAKAAKEGGFMGFGGEWVSESERSVISRISEAVGTATA